jgi:TonB-like protein
MRSQLLSFVVVCTLSVTMTVWSQTKEPPQSSPGHGNTNGNYSANDIQQLTKVPTGVILVKGAWSSASDSVTPLPEGGNVTNNIFHNDYFGIKYTLPSGWTEKYKGPPPSESGRYVLAQIEPENTEKAEARGNILLTADDMFFTPSPAANAPELINFMRDHLQNDYKVERPPTQVTIAGRSFTSFEYWSPIAQLHWYVLATQIRCHTVEMTLTSRDTNLLQRLLGSMNEMELPPDATPAVGDSVPVCIKDYARDNVLMRVEPTFRENRFNPVPVRIIIDTTGKVKNIHFLSAFPDQEKAITDALEQWRFRPYMQNGQAVEVETGIMFGRVAIPTPLKARIPRS